MRGKAMEEVGTAKRGSARNGALFVLLAVLVGAVSGAVVWGFLVLASLASDAVWGAAMPAWYRFAVCAGGGVLVGLLQKKFGRYPEEIGQVIGTVRRSGSYPAAGVPTGMIALMALIPIVCGASIGPEAGLTGVIAGLCCLAGEKLRYFGRNVRDMAQIGMSAALGVVFGAPLFGFALPLESAADGEKKTVLPGTARLAVYLLAVFGALGAFLLLSKVHGSGLSMPSFGTASAGTREYLFAVPAAAVALAGAYVFFLSGKALKGAFSRLEDKPALSAALGGLGLAAVSLFVPYAMFSGEAESTELMNAYPAFSGGALIAVGMVKIVMTNLCIRSGLRGGHFFPVIFGGIAIGYGTAALFGIDPVFAVVISVSVLMGAVLRKPVAAALLLLLCFPLSALPLILAAAFGGALIPLPKFLRPPEEKPGGVMARFRRKKG